MIFLFQQFTAVSGEISSKIYNMNTIENQKLKLKETTLIGDWIPRKVVKEFFGYGNTKMASFARDYDIRVSKVGKRVFYSYSDILRLLEEESLL